MKKSSFVEGAMIATISILVCKVIGLLYVIPFHSIIGNQGGALYSYAYSIYAIFLSLSTCGIPLAISKSISEYHSLGYQKAKRRTFRIGAITIIGLGFLCFMLLIFFAPTLAHMIIGDVEGGNSKESVAIAIRVVSCALLFVPILSVIKGYLQGHKIMTPSSIADVLEQIVRVLIIVIGSYSVVKVFHMPIEIAVYIAVSGAAFGAFASLLYLLFKIKKHKKELHQEPNSSEPKFSNKTLAKKIFVYALPFVLIDLIHSAYGMVDSFTVVKTMVGLGYDVQTAETTIGVLATWATKLNMIVASVAIGLTSSLIPHVAGSFAKNDMQDVAKKSNQALQMIIFTTLPMTVGIFFLAQPLWIVFYGYDVLSVSIFKFYIVQVIAFCFYTVALNLAQAMNNTKTVMIALIGSFIGKVILNIPMMHLCKMIGIESYYAPIITNIIAQGGAGLGMLIAIKRKYHFRYRRALQTFCKTVVGLLAMIAVLFLCSLIISPYPTSRVWSVITIIIYAVIGSIVYFFVSFKLKLFDNVFGRDMVNNIMNRFIKHKKKVGE